MIAGDHHRANAGRLGARHGLLRLLARRIDHADQAQRRRGPARRRSSTSSVLEAHPQAARGRRRPACAALRRRVLHCSAESPRDALRSKVWLSSPTSSCEQRASRTSGAPLVKTSRRSLAFGIGMDRAHQLALGRERDLADALETRVERFVLQTRLCAPRRSARLRSDRPAPSSARRALAARRCWRGRPTVSARSSSTRSAPSIAAARLVATALRLRARSRCRSKSTRPLAVTTARTVISFLVSVPVLSDAMTLAEPSVSTAARWRTMALRFAMRCTPRASTAVTTAGKPSAPPPPPAPRRE